MNHRQFWGKDMGEALRAVRKSLGSDALILETKDRPEALGGGVEITALAEKPEPQLAPSPPAAVPLASGIAVDELRQELASLKSMLAWLAPGLRHQDALLQALVDHGVGPEIIAKIAEAMQSSDVGDARERWFRAVASLVRSGGQIGSGPDRLVLMGPSGVGKTATLLKLTVFEKQRRDCRVGWINMDPYRLGGDPLAVYAGILEVQYEVAGSKKDLKRALERMRDRDLVIIDTAGVNPRDRDLRNGAAKLYRDFPELRRNLVLSATTHGRDMADWVRSYAEIGLDALVFTKLDECHYLGPLMNTVLGSDVPVSYITLGQNLSGDLAIARPEIFSSLVLTGVELHG